MDNCADCGAQLVAGPEAGFERSLCTDCAIRERLAWEERMDTKDCPRCRGKTRYWNRKAWRRDGREYCEKCVKDLERIWFIANSCMVCNEVICGHEKKMVPPERVQQKDPYVRSFVVQERAICWECYEEMVKKPFGVKRRGGGSGGTSNWGGGRAPSAVREHTTTRIGGLVGNLRRKLGVN